MRLRLVALVMAVAALAPLTSACTSDSSPSTPDSGGNVFPTEDGALCACATPDCLPNCSDLPQCKVVCENGNDADLGAAVTFSDSCGNIDYVQACASGCADAATPACQ